MIRLESTKLFSTLAPKDLDRVRPAVREITFPAGHEIFVEGEAGNGIYIVKDGLVQISAVLDYGNRLVLTRLGDGEIFGELSVMDQDPRSATATAERETQVYFIPREELMEMLEAIPHLSACFVREISRRLRDFNGRYIREVLQSERLALIGRFASFIVHDLKNPLGIIGVSAERAVEENATAQTRVLSRDRILQQVERIGGMANELLEFARGSQPSMILAAVDFAVFVGNLLEEINAEAASNAVRVEIQTQPPSVPMKIEPARLSRVFHNLIQNAMDAMPQGGKLIFRFTLDGRAVLTEVEDSGPGIAPEMENKLFEPFTTHGKPEGTGLGLTICKRIIEDHKGRIYSRVEPGRGAIFGFTLPIQPV